MDRQEALSRFFVELDSYVDQRIAYANNGGWTEPDRVYVLAALDRLLDVEAAETIAATRSEK